MYYSEGIIEQDKGQPILFVQLYRSKAGDGIFNFYNFGFVIDLRRNRTSFFSNICSQFDTGFKYSFIYKFFFKVILM